MVVTPSTMLALGTKAPEFDLFDTASKTRKSLAELKSDKATVIMFICNHCPYVKHVQPELIKLANDYKAKGISFIAISSNDATDYPEDSPEQMHLEVINKKLPFPYLYDENQEVANAYSAACTPDFYIFDKNMLCVYRGQLDDSRPKNNIPLSGSDIRAALDNILSENPVSSEQKPSTGCNIKWKS